MKKLFFTAIALVAFSGVSMANNILTDDTKTKEEVSSKKPLEEGITEDCYKRASYYLEGIDPYGVLSDVTANGIYQNFFTYCIKQGMRN